MTRGKVFTGLLHIITNDDVVFCVGSELLGEAKFDGFDGACYFDDLSIDYLAVALGIAMSSKKRVFFICDDSYIIRYISTIIQVNASECVNLYMLILNTGFYSNQLEIVSLSKSIRSLKGTFFNLGVLVHDYTVYFEDKRSVVKLRGIVNSSVGPLLALIKIDNKRLYNKGGNEPSLDLSTFCNFIKGDLDEEYNTEGFI